MNEQPRKKAGKMPIATRKEFELEWSRRRFVRYCQLVHHGSWIPGRHHTLICEHLDAVTRGELTRLMICMPPRHGKSMSVTETYPSYFLGRYPDKRVMEVSYNDTFAQKFGRKNREKIEEYGQRLWGIGISGHRSASNWTLTANGDDIRWLRRRYRRRRDPLSSTTRQEPQELTRQCGSGYGTNTRPLSLPPHPARQSRDHDPMHEDDLCGRLQPLL